MRHNASHLRSASLAAPRQSQNASMTRRHFPKQMLGNGILIRGFDLLKNKSGGNPFVLAPEKLSRPHHARVCADGSAGQAQFHGHNRTEWNSRLLRDGKSVAIQIPREAAPDDVSAIVVVSEKHRNIQSARKTIHRTQLLMMKSTPDNRHKQKNVKRRPHHVDHDRPKIISM